MTNEELVTQYQSGNKQALAELCTRNKGLVARIARGLTGDIEDLMQAGMIGIIDAAERFDVERGAKFTTYASSWIFCHCVEHAREMNGIVRVNGREGRRILNLIVRVKKHLLRDLGREPTISEIAKEMQIDEKAVASVVGTSKVGFDNPNGDDNSFSLHEVIPDDSRTPYQHSEANSTREAVRGFAEELESDSERFVFLNVMAGEMTNQEAGDIRGVSRQRINQIVCKLRPQFKEYAERNNIY